MNIKGPQSVVQLSKTQVTPSPREVAAKGHPGTTVKELMDEANETHEKIVAHHKKPNPMVERFKSIMKKYNVL